MLCRQDHRAETGSRETIVLGGTHTAGVTTTSVVLAEIPVFGSEIEAATDNGTTGSTGADVEVFPFVELGITGGTIRNCGQWNGMRFLPCHRKMIR